MIRVCNECWHVGGHSPNCPEAEDIPTGWDECKECGEIWGRSFINKHGVCADCEDKSEVCDHE